MDDTEPTGAVLTRLNWNVYKAKVREAMRDVDLAHLHDLVEDLRSVYARDGQVFVLGNGGSQANAAHLVLHMRNAGFRAWDCLGDNAWVSATANDHGYDTVGALLLFQRAGPDDALLVISGSGDSPNVLRAIEQARCQDMEVFGLLGFGGGKAAAGLDSGVVLPEEEFGPVEDVHSIIIHYLATAL